MEQETAGERVKPPSRLRLAAGFFLSPDLLLLRSPALFFAWQAKNRGDKI